MTPHSPASTAPCCLLPLLTEAAACLAWTAAYCLSQTLLRNAPSAFWAHGPVPHFWTVLALAVRLCFSHLIGDPTLKGFQGRTGLWLLDLPRLVYPNPSQFPVTVYKVFMDIPWARLSYLGPSLRMEATVSRLTPYVPVNKQPVQQMTL